MLGGFTPKRHYLLVPNNKNKALGMSSREEQLQLSQKNTST